jgi:hypothetical protein
MTRLALYLVLLLAVLVAGHLDAHELRPSYLELRQTGPETFEVRWKVPARNDLQLGIHPQFPEHCTLASEVVSFLSAEAYHERTTLSCPGGLDGHRIAIDGLTATLTDVLVRLARMDGAVRVVRLTPSAPSLVVEPAPGQLQKAATYLRLGVEHILLGIDHLLFVLGLLLIVKDRRMLWQSQQRPHVPDHRVVHPQAGGPRVCRDAREVGAPLRGHADQGRRRDASVPLAQR